MSLFDCQNSDSNDGVMRGSRCTHASNSGMAGCTHTHVLAEKGKKGLPACTQAGKAILKFTMGDCMQVKCYGGGCSGANVWVGWCASMGATLLELSIGEVQYASAALLWVCPWDPPHLGI